MRRSDRWLRFIETLMIRTRGRELVHFRYWEPQMRVYEAVRDKIDRAEPINLIVLKARRQGVSSLVESWLLTLVASGDLVNAAVIAHQAKASKRIWDMSKLFVTSSPLLSRLCTIEAHRLVFGKSVLEVSTAGSPEAERSGDLTALHASEVAFWTHPQTLLAVEQTVPHKGLTITVLESTANGRVGDGELFYTEWQRAEEGDSERIPIFLPWHVFKEYEMPGIAIEDPDAEERMLRERFELSDAKLAWRRWALANKCQGDLDKLHQEYPSSANESFVQSGLPFFRQEHLHPIQAHLRRGTMGTVEPDGRWVPSAGGPVEIYRFPEAGHSYVIGADSSMGLDNQADGCSRSRSAAEVLDMETLEQVAEYDAATAPHAMARHLAGLGRMYHNALIAPEVQSSGGGGGREIIVYLRDLGYWNLHRWRQADKINRDHGTLLGWETTSRTRPRMLARIREVVMERSAVIHSRRLFNQLAAFGENDAGRMEALAGHDDLLFAWGIALMSRSENYFRMPVVDPGPVQEPDWSQWGMRVLRQETPDQRLRRILAISDWDPPEKTFLEL